MTTANDIARESSSAGLLGNPQGELSLRIRGGRRDGQTLRIQGAKCAVGASDQCTVRLQAAGIHPVHCLILRGQGGTVVRRWSADTRLNGRTFTDAPLLPGDRLGVGPLEFDVLATTRDDGLPLVEPDTVTAPAAGGRLEKEIAPTSARLADSVERVCKQLDVQSHKLDQHRELWVEERNQRDADLQRRAADVQSQRTELDAAQEELAQASDELSSRSDQLQEQSRQLETERSQLLSQRQEWLSEHERAVAELERRGIRLDELAEQLAEQGKRLHQERDTWDEERRGLETQLTEVREAAAGVVEPAGQEAARQQEFNEQRRQFQTQHADWEHRRQQAERDLLQRTEQLDARVGQLVDQMRRIESERSGSDEDIHRRYAELDEAQKAAQAESAEQNRQLQQRRDEVEAEGNKLLREREDWLVERERARDELNERTGQLDDRLNQLSEEATCLQQKRSEWESERLRLEEELEASRRQSADTASDLTERSEFFVRQQSELDATRDELRSQRTAWEEEQKSAQAELNEWANRLEEQQQELTLRAQELQQRRQRWDEERRTAEVEITGSSTFNLADVLTPDIHTSDVQAAVEGDAKAIDSQVDDNGTSPERGAPVNATEVLEKFGRGTEEVDKIKNDDEPTEPGEESTDVDPQSGADSATELFAGDSDFVFAETDDAAITRDGASSDDVSETLDGEVSENRDQDEEQDIADYMAGLLKRARGRGEPAVQISAADRQDEESASATNEDTHIPSAPVDRPQRDSTDVVRKEPAQPVRRPLPAERSSDLRAMRELCNQNARRAIDKHTRRRWIRAATGKIAVAATALAAGTYLWITTDDIYSGAYYGAVAGFIIATFWTLQAAILVKHVISAGDRAAKEQERESTADASETS